MATRGDGYDRDHALAALTSTVAGTLLVVVHTHEALDAGEARVRIISAREATPRERRSYEDEPR